MGTIIGVLLLLVIGLLVAGIFEAGFKAGQRSLHIPAHGPRAATRGVSRRGVIDHERAGWL